ncbi:Bug family tripartite tricarboxylate transporter substrate binding protein [Polaromonas sp. P2-4]|nr:Bug family tripartite tricarboxylate transporter substrate binding protein [Polaromonas sp. P2-4]
MSFKVMRKMFVGLCVGASVLGTATAQTSDRVSGPVKLLVGFPAGGTGDFIARAVADKLSASLGATVIVENKPGAGGRIAAEVLKNAPADGNTVLITPLAPIVIAPLTFRKLSYNAEADFVPVAQLVKFPLTIATGANSPYKTLNEFVAWLKANPTQAAFGTSAAGSQLHFLGLMFGQAINVEMTHVPYQGSAPLANDLIGGQTPAGIDQFSVELYKAGKIRLLATSGATRSPLMPDVPTFKEQGFPGVVGEAWFGAYMHAKTPATIVQRFSEALANAVLQPDVKQKLAQAGLEATGLKAPEFTALVAADRARWKPVIEASGFRGD